MTSMSIRSSGRKTAAQAALRLRSPVTRHADKFSSSEVMARSGSKLRAVAKKSLPHSAAVRKNAKRGYAAAFVKKYSSPQTLTGGSSLKFGGKQVTRRIDFDLDSDNSAAPEEEIADMFREALQQVDAEKDPTSSSVTKQINDCRFGRYEIRAWYPSPYPESLAYLNRVYICEFCLKCLSSATLLRRHAAKCIWRHPPGNEIYRDKVKNLSIWEVDGKLAKIYCQNLCLLAKLFLDHKTLYFDVEPFLFYVLTEADAEGCHMIGYFSKEKESVMNCNLSCLLTLPPFMRRGYGRYLIEFSYLLSKVENKIGSPEHPLSDMGLLTYRNYWKDAIFEYLEKIYKVRVSVSIKDMSLETGIHPNDIVSTLQFLGMIKYWKGQYVLDKKPEVFDGFLAKKARRQKLKIDPKHLRWTPGESQN